MSNKTGDTVSCYWRHKSGKKSGSPANGKIDRVHDDGSVNVQFDDGTHQSKLPADWIVSNDKLRERTEKGSDQKKKKAKKSKSGDVVVENYTPIMATSSGAASKSASVKPIVVEKAAVKNKQGGIKSNYYHFASTSKEEAEKFKPKKVASPQALQRQPSAKGASAWNAGGNTVETGDYTKWIKSRFKEMLLEVTFPDGVKFTSIEKTNGHASVVVSRGKIKTPFDISFEAKFSGTWNGAEYEGKCSIEDITPDDEAEDWDTTITTTKGPSGPARVIENNLSLLEDITKKLTAELKSKKK